MNRLTRLVIVATLLLGCVVCDQVTKDPARVHLGDGLVVLGLLGAALFRRGLRRPQVVALTLLAASGLGNLIDRVLHDGAVTDFLNIGIGPLRTGIFNVADIAGVLGVVVLLLFRGTASAAGRQNHRQ
jgi:lipoprotein signal peptidase